MKLCSLQTLVAVLATSTLASAAHIDSSRLPLQAREEQQSDSVSVTSAGDTPADGEYVILSDEGVEQASVVVHKGTVAATEEASLRKLYAWLGAYFARRDHASDVPLLSAKSGVLHPQHAVIYKQAQPPFAQQAVPSYAQQPAYSPYIRTSAPAYGQAYGQTYGQAYGQSHRPFAGQQSYRPKPQAYQYSNPGYNTNPGYNGYPGNSGNAGFSSPGYNTNPGYNGHPGYGSSPYAAYAAHNPLPYAAYAYNAYMQNLRSAMANYGAQAAAPHDDVRYNKGVASKNDASSSVNVAPSEDAAPSFNGFTSSLPGSGDHAQKQSVHSLPGFAAFPPDSLAALVSPVSDPQPSGGGANLQAEFDEQQEKMLHELELQQKALEEQRKYYEQQVKLQKDLELQEKALQVQRDYHEQQEKLKALHEAQEAAKEDAVVSDAGEAPEYDEVEMEGDGDKTPGKSFLYGAYRGAADE